MRRIDYGADGSVVGIGRSCAPLNSRVRRSHAPDNLCRCTNGRVAQHLPGGSTLCTSDSVRLPMRAAASAASVGAGKPLRKQAPPPYFPVWKLFVCDVVVLTYYAWRSTNSQ